MSKNITIAEGTQARNFNNIHKLRTNLIGGGTQYWVPEDEAGDYAKLSEKTITKNGTYNASDDDKDGYFRVNVNVKGEGGVTLISKTISENGTYNASDDNADGYSSVTVNGIGIANGIAQEGDSIGGNSLTPGEEYAIGKDPETGKLKAILMPSYILINPLPTKLRYNDNENIDFTGAIVKAYTKNDVLWTDSNHPQGIIPYNELAISPNRANYSYAQADYFDSIIYDTTGLDEKTINALPIGYDYADSVTFDGVYTSGEEYGSSSAIQDIVGEDIVYAMAISDSNEEGHAIYAFSKQPFTAVRKSWNKYGQYSAALVSQTSIVNGKQICWCGAVGWSSNESRSVSLPINKWASVSQAAYVCLYGRTIIKQRVTANWNRPDGALLKASFLIDVVKEIEL